MCVLEWRDLNTNFRQYFINLLKDSNYFGPTLYIYNQSTILFTTEKNESTYYLRVLIKKGVF